MDTKFMLQMSELANTTTKKHITILGAGIAGLVAAYELEKMGHTVDIMEASNRIGGRIWTHRFGEEKDAPYAELGAMRIPSDHQHTLHYVEEMGLADRLCKFVTVFEEQNAFINVEGKIFKMKDAPRIFQQRYQGIFTDERYSEQTRLFTSWMKTIVDTISPGDLRESLEQSLDQDLAWIFDDYIYSLFQRKRNLSMVGPTHWILHTLHVKRYTKQLSSQSNL